MALPGLEAAVTTVSVSPNCAGLSSSSLNCQFQRTVHCGASGECSSRIPRRGPSPSRARSSTIGRVTVTTSSSHSALTFLPPSSRQMVPVAACSLFLALLSQSSEPLLPRCIFSNDDNCQNPDSRYNKFSVQSMEKQHTFFSQFIQSRRPSDLSEGSPTSEVVCVCVQKKDPGH